MQEKDAKEILNRYKAGIATGEEKALVEGWYASVNEADFSYSEEGIREAQAEVYRKLPIHQQPVYNRLRQRIAVAASLILCLSVAAYFLSHRNSLQTATKIQKSDALPGTNRAVLTLANGQRIILNGKQAGLLAKQGNVSIDKTADGQLLYRKGDADKYTTVMQYNTLRTPRGGQYRVLLADGTTVWLNAASSIKYPAAFAGKDRQVEITGEAYFEVAHDAAKPFRVISNGQTVEVLGTHFNVNAYADERVTKTTLLEGKVQIASNGKAAILLPGQQAVSGNGLTLLVKYVTADATVDWKNGLFIFEDEPLESIMRKVSRWYDVDVIYRDIDPHKSFWGSVSRYDKVSGVLRKLELTGGVHFTIEGRRIIAAN